ncbi:MAG: hypothetical protein KKD35_07260, partial [Elusimicrobia bacterium]|nr:hypothetical protein [Elusimicrobiota bacterium]
MNIKKFLLKTTEDAICVLGPQDSKLKLLEKKLNISIFVRHSRKDETVTLTLKGSNSSTDKAIRYIRQTIIEYKSVSSIAFPNKRDLLTQDMKLPENAIFRTEYGELIFPRSKTQGNYVKDLLSTDM